MLPERWLPETLAELMRGQELDPARLRTGLVALLAGQMPEAEAAAFLVALRMKGETASEIATAATVLREQMVAWDAGPEPVLDTCGTGGDGAATFNISTAVAFVVAACGVRVVKHGNRAVSSKSGSTDVLALLGVPLVADGAAARSMLDRHGLVFCFAPHFHPALAGLAPLRRRLGVATLFNWLGPLANPARAARQLMGVGRQELLDSVAGALARLGAEHALVVRGEDGLDEVSLAAATQVRQVQGGTVRALVWTPADFGLEACNRDELRVDGPEQSAVLLRQVLEGVAGPAARVVLANAAAALFAGQRVDSLGEGVALARLAIASGSARKLLLAMSVPAAG